MKKISFIGAGSFQFTTAVVKDLALFPAFNDAHICLMDINAHNLAEITKCVERIKNEMDVDFKITSTTSREEALFNADAVLCTVFNGDVDIWRHEIEIPKKYGVDINIGDTRSVSGIFRALRNIPLMLDICRDIERICPNTVFLNYTNPMSMLCKAMQTLTNVDVTGLCHSVQGTSEMLAKWAGKDYSTIKYTCVGINHLAFFSEITSNGEDIYPIIKERIKESEINAEECVRNELFKMFGYYVTESSGHNSEYTPWFRKKTEYIDKYCRSTSWNSGEYAFSLKQRLCAERFDNSIKNWFEKPLDKTKSHEYAADIINARIGDNTPFEFNANVLNKGSVKNLPEDACVEIPVIASKEGYKRMFCGNMPGVPAIYVSYVAGIENLVFEAFLEKSKEKVIQAVSLDPLCAAVLSLEEIRNMCEELFEVNKEYLSDYK